MSVNVGRKLLRHGVNSIVNVKATAKDFSLILIDRYGMRELVLRLKYPWTGQLYDVYYFQAGPNVTARRKSKHPAILNTAAMCYNKPGFLPRDARWRELRASLQAYAASFTESVGSNEPD